MKKNFLFQGEKIIWHLRSGQLARPIVLVHGFCEDHRIWRATQPFLPKASIHTVDLPGFGDSPTQATTSIGRYAEAIAAYIQSEKLHQPLIVGHSLGGYVALELLSRHPELIGGCTLLHSHAFEDSPERLEIRQKGIELVESGKKTLYVRNLFAGLFAPAFAEKHPDIVERCTLMGQQQTAKGIVSAIRAMMGRSNHLATLAATQIPVQFILGDQDALIPVPMALDMTHRPALARIDLLPGIGHMGMIENPEVTAAALTAFYNFLSA